jgi:hypothetical protein
MVQAAGDRRVGDRFSLTPAAPTEHLATIYFYNGKFLKINENYFHLAIDK